MTTVIIDYGVGNLFSLKSSFAAIGKKAVVSNNKNDILRADRIVLPGVGAFSDAREKLKSSGLDKILTETVKNGTPLLGICLGMQLLFDKSFEYGEYEGLGLIGGNVKPIPKKDGLKIPHIGWNALRFKREHPLFKYIKDGDFVYFVHSYYAADCDKSVIATTDYGSVITAAVSDKNVLGCQFHPEKSGDAGLKILKAFCEIKRGDL